MPTGTNLLVEILNRDGPKTYSELMHYPDNERVDKNVPLRALRSDRVKFAFILEGKDGESVKAVKLYYTESKQLHSRKGVLIPVTGLKEIEANMIRNYVTKYDADTILLGNAETELAFELNGDSDICVRRRDLLRRLAKRRGIEVKKGFDESIPPEGSLRWWQVHRNHVTGQVEKLISHPLAEFNFPEYEEYTRSFSRWPVLQPGCQLGSIRFPQLEEISKADELSSLFRTLSHLEKKDGLEKKLEESIAHCQKGLELTRKTWATLNQFVIRVFSKTTQDTQVPRVKPEYLNRAVCFLYVLTYRESVFSRLLVGGYKHWHVRPDTPAIKTILTLLRLKPGEIDVNGLARDLAALEDEELIGSMGQSIDEFDISDRKIDEFFEALHSISAEWTDKGLTGRCETCRKVEPGPEVI